MNRGRFRAAVVCMLILATGCAPSPARRVAVASYDYPDLVYEDEVFVTTKDKQVYKLTQVEITATHIRGFGTVRDADGVAIGESEVEISLDDVALIEVGRSEDSDTSVIVYVLAGLGVLVLVVLITCGILTAVG